MRLEHRLGVERLEALEQRRPQKGDKAPRNDELGKPGELVEDSSPRVTARSAAARSSAMPRAAASR